jgi:hypothetical protein
MVESYLLAWSSATYYAIESPDSDAVEDEVNDFSSGCPSKGKLLADAVGDNKTTVAARARLDLIRRDVLPHVRADARASQIMGLAAASVRV